MKYSDVLSAVELVIESNDVPLIIGESGICILYTSPRPRD